MPALAMDEVARHPITQATTATFADLYLRVAFLFFIQTGSKEMRTPSETFVAEEGGLLVCPPGSMVTMENRPVLGRSYRAVGLSFPDPMVRAVFAGGSSRTAGNSIQLLRGAEHQPMDILPIIEETLHNQSLPPVIKQNRLAEPLLWLKAKGLHLSVPCQEAPMSRVRRLIETDLSHPWRASEAAQHLAMSEPTLRRVLANGGQGFAKILLHTRLERGLGLLQTSEVAISEIALRCGFKTPSHFSDAFRKRFGIRPREIRSPGD
ncbi:MAG: AraC family transcriptional regulator [Pseudomonadota bacterium]